MPAGKMQSRKPEAVVSRRYEVLQTSPAPQTPRPQGAGRSSTKIDFPHIVQSGQIREGDRVQRFFSYPRCAWRLDLLSLVLQPNRPGWTIRDGDAVNRDLATLWELRPRLISCGPTPTRSVRMSRWQAPRERWTLRITREVARLWNCRQPSRGHQAPHGGKGALCAGSGQELTDMRKTTVS